MAIASARRFLTLFIVLALATTFVWVRSRPAGAENCECVQGDICARVWMWTGDPDPMGPMGPKDGGHGAGAGHCSDDPTWLGDDAYGVGWDIWVAVP